MKKIFSAGADKICINSSIIENPSLLKKASKIFGSANLVVMIQAIKIKKNITLVSQMVET